MPEIIIGVTIVAAGLLVGIEFCVAVFINPMADALPASGGLSVRAGSARILGAVMPFWYAATVALSTCASVLLWPEPSGIASAVATGLFATTIVLAVVVLVPINNRVKDWSNGNHPLDWRAQVHRWDRWHVLRLLLGAAGLILLVAAGLIGA